MPARVSTIAATSTGVTCVTIIAESFVSPLL